MSYDPYREQEKDYWEEEGRKAFGKNIPKWKNPHLTFYERQDMMKGMPVPLADKISAYYWEIGWENAEQEALARA